MAHLLGGVLVVLLVGGELFGVVVVVVEHDLDVLRLLVVVVVVELGGQQWICGGRNGRDTCEPGKAEFWANGVRGGRGRGVRETGFKSVAGALHALPATTAETATIYSPECALVAPLPLPLPLQPVGGPRG